MFSVFTVTFDQSSASLQNKTIHFFQKSPYWSQSVSGCIRFSITVVHVCVFEQEETLLSSSSSVHSSAPPFSMSLIYINKLLGAVSLLSACGKVCEENDWSRSHYSPRRAKRPDSSLFVREPSPKLIGGHNRMTNEGC